MKIRAGWIHASKTRRPGSRALLILRSLGLMWAITYFASAAIAQTRYQIIRIPVASGANSVALGLNDKGEVVGYSFQGDDYQAFLFSYADKSMTEIGSLGGKLNAACAINSAGQVTGYSQDANGNLLAFLFSRNAPIAPLGTLEGGSTSEAFGINNRGAVVGDSQSGGQNHRPVLFRATTHSTPFFLPTAIRRTSAPWEEQTARRWLSTKRVRWWAIARLRTALPMLSL